MSEINSGRRSSLGAPWLWVLATLLLFVAIWWITGVATREQRAYEFGVREQVAGSRMETPPLTGGEWLPLAAMRANPDGYFGQSISGVGSVAEVVSNRGFWIEQRGSRVFVVKDEALLDVPAISVGQQISLKGMVHNPDQMQQVPGIMKLDEATMKLLQGEPAFIQATAIEVQDTQG